MPTKCIRKSQSNASMRFLYIYGFKNSRKTLKCLKILGKKDCNVLNLFDNSDKILKCLFFEGYWLQKFSTVLCEEFVLARDPFDAVDYGAFAHPGATVDNRFLDEIPFFEGCIFGVGYSDASPSFARVLRNLIKIDVYRAITQIQMQKQLINELVNAKSLVHVIISH